MSAPYRIEQSSSIKATSADGSGGTADEIASRAMKLIPAEVITAYAALQAIFMPAAADPPILDIDPTGYFAVNWVIPIVGLLAVIGLRSWGTIRPGQGLGDIQWPTLGLAVLVYIGWLLTQPAPIFGFESPDTRIGAALMIVFGLIPPFFYKKGSS